MFHMLTCFNLNAGQHIESFQKSLESYANHLVEKGLLEALGPIGKRESDTILDTEGRDHDYYMIMSFNDKAQSDATVKYIEEQTEPAATLHKSVYRNIVDPVFICWQDL